MKNALRFIVTTVLPETFMEFLWLFFSMALGMALAGVALDVSQDIYTGLVQAYIVYAVMVVFNAAMLRVLLRHGLDWLDKRLQAQQETQAQNAALARVGVKMAIQTLFPWMREKKSDEEIPGE
jgi:hypothetical protein